MKNNKLFKYLSLVPVSIYVILLIALPLIYIFILSFLTNDYYGGIKIFPTLMNYINIFDMVYLKVFFKSFLIALVSTFICICIAYPFVIFISKKEARVKSTLMTLVMLPFLTNSLIRTYGWIVLLRRTGIINTFLQNIHLTENPISFMYNNFGIILGMVYTLLPFMILPLFSSVDKINKSVIEASYDLGASKIKTFFKVIVPQTKTGLFNGSLMVFIPSIGYFFIADLLGGGKLMLIGNLIKNQFLTARNWPFGAAISITLLLITFLLVKLYQKIGGKLDNLGGF